MIHITKDSTSQITVTFTELMTDFSDWILVSLESEFTKESSLQYFLLKDNLSLSPGRYDIFEITETSGTTDPESAIIDIPATGFYIYTAYQYDKTVVFDPINPLIGKVLETGRAKVTGTDEVNTDPIIPSVYQ